MSHKIDSIMDLRVYAPIQPPNDKSGAYKEGWTSWANFHNGKMTEGSALSGVTGGIIPPFYGPVIPPPPRTAHDGTITKDESDKHQGAMDAYQTTLDIYEERVKEIEDKRRERRWRIANTIATTCLVLLCLIAVIIASFMGSE